MNYKGFKQQRREKKKRQHKCKQEILDYIQDDWVNFFDIAIATNWAKGTVTRHCNTFLKEGLIEKTYKVRNDGEFGCYAVTHVRRMIR